MTVEMLFAAGGMAQAAAVGAGEALELPAKRKRRPPVYETGERQKQFNALLL